MQKYGGISLYFSKLIKYLGDEAIVPSMFSNNENVKNLGLYNVKPFLENLSFKGKTKILSLINKMASKKFILNRDFDLFHPTYYDPYFLDILGDKPFIITVYDMTHEKYPEMFEGDNTSEQKRLLAESANKVIAISKKTKEDLTKLFNIPEGKVNVIHLATDRHPKVVKIDNDIPERYFMFVGNRSLYKNFAKYIAAVSKLLINDKDLYFVCAGSENFSEEEKALLEKLGIRNKVLYIKINEYTLNYLYSKAIAFVFPSLYEGFGIPILEAFSMQCPVVLSNTGCFQEIAEDAGYYFDPNDKDSMLMATERILSDSQLRSKLVNKGSSRLRFFSWKKMADQTRDLYNTLI